MRGIWRCRETTPHTAPGNIALVMFSDPEATVFGTRDRWKTLNRSVMDSEKNNGVKIFARLSHGARLYAC